MPGDDERRVTRFWCMGEGVLLDDTPGAGQQRGGHARVRADRFAVVQTLPAVLADAFERLVIVCPEAKFSRQNLPGEVPLADEQRHDEHAPGSNAAQHAAHVGLLLEKAHPNLGEQPARAQFVGVLVGRLG